MTTWTADSFVGGHPSLDLLNTAGGRTRDREVERLTDFAEAAHWARHGGTVDEAELARLLALAEADPADAARALDELRAQRETLHRFLLAAVGAAEPDEEVRELVADGLIAAWRRARLSGELHQPHAWTLDLDREGVRVIAGRLALATGELLAGPHRAEISLCGRCSWLFLDPSPSRRRRWCSMAVCGNRAKVQKHQQR